MEHCTPYVGAVSTDRLQYLCLLPFIWYSYTSTYEYSIPQTLSCITFFTAFVNVVSGVIIEINFYTKLKFLEISISMLN